MDPFSNPQNKLIQQTHSQTNQSNPLPKGGTVSPNTNIPQQDPKSHNIPGELSGQQVTEAQQLQQENKKGFKAFLNQAKNKTIEGGKQQFIQQVEGSQETKPQPDNNIPNLPNPQLEQTSKPNRPQPNRPQVNPPRPNPPRPNPPRPQIPNFKK